MSEIVLDEHLREAPSRGASSVMPRLLQIAWRNVWRNRRRTLLTAGGIIFSVWLLVFARSFQDGAFAQMTDIAARAMPGHLQVQHPLYEEEPRLEHTVDALDARNRLIETNKFSFVSARLQSSAIFSGDEKSSAGMVMGIEPDIEAQWNNIASSVVEGRYLSASGELVIGEILARNLGAQLGDNLVILGTAKQGGIAAHAGRVVGIFASGAAEADRSLVQIPVADFRQAWSMGSREAHMVVGVSDKLRQSEEGFRLLSVGSAVGSEFRYLPWQELIPDMVSLTEMKAVGTNFMFYFLCIIIIFSIVNSFMMLVYERTNEMGVLLALGMRPHQLLFQFQAEAFFMSSLGLVLGSVATLATLLPLSNYGMALPASVLEAYPPEFLNMMPERLYPGVSWGSMWLAVVTISVGVQLASLIPCLRILRLHPVEAIRAEN